MSANMSKRQSKASKKAELRDAIKAIDARKASMGKPKLLADIRREVAAKSAAEKTARKKKKRAPNSPWNDSLFKGHRLPGSGWAGKRQK
jgi:hypothetical protein